MSVYTKITEAELELHLKNYSVGKIINFSGISEGIENTNYLLVTDNGEFIFTIFEAIKAEKVNSYLSFMNHVHLKGLESPLVIESNDSELYKIIKNKPSAVIQKLDGKSIGQPNNQHCTQLGKTLSGFHAYGSDFSSEILNPRGLMWAEKALGKLKGLVCESKLKLIKELWMALFQLLQIYFLSTLFLISC